MASWILVLFILSCSSAELLAQRITYESLRMRDRQPNVFFEHLVLPDPASDNKNLYTIFRIENNFLSYRRYRDTDSPEDQRRFYAEPTVRLTIRRSDSGESASQGSPDAIRTWNETIYAETFEQAQSTTSFVQNMIRTSLAPGKYDIESTTSSENRSRRGRASGFQVADTSNSEIAYFYFLDTPSELSAPFEAPLMNMGRNVAFGRDHQLAIWIPDINEQADYRLEIDQLRIRRQDTTNVDRVFEYTLDNDHMVAGYSADIRQINDRPHFELVSSVDAPAPEQYYLLHIPNSTFENAHYRMKLIKKSGNGEESGLAERVYQSLWLDMPVSLLNLDVAINMMEYILDDETFRAMRRGSRSEREQRFRDFWKERDPSPDREYNELMVEYFRRIDYAYENFTTPQSPGYESDQGRVYIRNGEPNRRERNFPPNQPAREIWHYSDRTFVFEATTGFGDYRLIERR